MPVLSTHGNHDPVQLDSVSNKAVSPLDCLAVNDLIQLISTGSLGSTVDVTPVFVKKGKTWAGIWGMG